jgi:hypothetical protein
MRTPAGEPSTRDPATRGSDEAGGGRGRLLRLLAFGLGMVLLIFAAAALPVWLG